ncbi:MAG: NAD(P)/FAD-dependent oxidoreductase [Candidatus Methanoplasma sp.]|jgi:thioredoxin reductase (NADPH)|nr:NAD(P)/FAD-dependent oxidoreductase [Candidatus Methanoplasma sp.]
MNADVVIIGCGPAGLQAGIHSSRKKADTVIIGKLQNSALYNAHVENYFGVPGKTDGSMLLKMGLEQALSFGCRHIDLNVIRAVAEGDAFWITVESGEEIRCRSIVIATGISRMKLGIPGEKELLGKGVSYCAECDCNFFRGLKVAIIGGESKAAVSAELMTRYASEVYWVSKDISADKMLVDRAVKEGVKIVSAVPAEIKGGKNVESLLLEDGREISVDGVFIELGGKSSSDLAMDLEILPEADDSIKIDNAGRTSVAGIFACGDVTGGPYQMAKAVGEGVVSGLNAADYAKGLK